MRSLLLMSSQDRTQRSGSYSHAASPEPEPEPEPELPRDPYDAFVSCYPLLVGALITRRPAKARLDAVVSSLAVHSDAACGQSTR